MILSLFLYIVFVFFLKFEIILLSLVLVMLSFILLSENMFKLLLKLPFILSKYLNFHTSTKVSKQPEIKTLFSFGLKSTLVTISLCSYSLSKQLFPS